MTLIVGFAGLAQAQNAGQIANEGYVACLRGAAIKFDDDKSDARTIASAIAALCAGERLEALRQNSPYPSSEEAQRLLQALREHDLDVATLAVLRERRERAK